MKAGSTMLGLTAACAACCAVPLIAAATAGIGLAGLSTAWLGWGVGLVVASTAVAAFVFARRQSSTRSCQSQSCGCGSALSLTVRDEDAATPTDKSPAIACSLGAGDFRERSAWIHDLARNHLRRSQRTPLALHLTYAPHAAPQVRELVEKEQACCSFLRFDLREEPDAIRLTITAPEEAREAADTLFDHFAPDANPAAGKPIAA